MLRGVWEEACMCESALPPKAWMWLISEDWLKDLSILSILKIKHSRFRYHLTFSRFYPKNRSNTECKDKECNGITCLFLSLLQFLSTSKSVGLIRLWNDCNQENRLNPVEKQVYLGFSGAFSPRKISIRAVVTTKEGFVLPEKGFHLSHRLQTKAKLMQRCIEVHEFEEILLELKPPFAAIVSILSKHFCLFFCTSIHWSDHKTNKPRIKS